MVMLNANGTKKEPIEGHDKCPDCGSEKRLVAGYVAELKEKGVISQESFPEGAGVWELPFMDLKKISAIQLPGTIRPFPVMRILFDVCEDCMKPFIIKVEFAERGIINPQAISQQAPKV